MAKIKGGYYIKARCIQDSSISGCPPHVREIWDWLLQQANHKERKVGRTIIKRGQCVRTYKDIQKGLSWMIGWRKMAYSKWDCEGAMKKLRSLGCITTQKTTRGIFITIIKYEVYQNPKNYDSHMDNHMDNHRPPQTRHTINKNDKNDKNKESNTTTMQEVLDRWNKKLPFKTRGLSDNRRDHLRTRLQEPLFVDNIDTIIDKIRNNDFLTGRAPSKDHPNFKADFDWIIKNNTNYLKVLEGKYDKKCGRGDV